MQGSIPLPLSIVPSSSPTLLLRSFTNTCSNGTSDIQQMLDIFGGEREAYSAVLGKVVLPAQGFLLAVLYVVLKIKPRPPSKQSMCSSSLNSLLTLDFPS